MLVIPAGHSLPLKCGSSQTVAAWKSVTAAAKRSMQPSVDDLLDLLLDGDPVAWEISRTPEGFQIVGLMENGETRVIANVPINTEEGQ